MEDMVCAAVAAVFATSAWLVISGGTPDEEVGDGRVGFQEAPSQAPNMALTTT